MEKSPKKRSTSFSVCACSLYVRVCVTFFCVCASEVRWLRHALVTRKWESRAKERANAPKKWREWERIACSLDGIYEWMNFRSLCKDVFANTLASIHSNQFRASLNEYYYSVLVTFYNFSTGFCLNSKVLCYYCCYCCTGTYINRSQFGIHRDTGSQALRALLSLGFEMCLLHLCCLEKFGNIFAPSRSFSTHTHSVFVYTPT